MPICVKMYLCIYIRTCTYNIYASAPPSEPTVCLDACIEQLDIAKRLRPFLRMVENVLLVVCHCPGSRALTCFPNTISITRKHFQYSQPSHQHKSNHQLHGNPTKMNGLKWPNDLACSLGRLAVLSHTTSRLRSGQPEVCSPHR